MLAYSTRPLNDMIGKESRYVEGRVRRSKWDLSVIRLDRDTMVYSVICVCADRLIYK